MCWQPVQQSVVEQLVRQWLCFRLAVAKLSLGSQPMQLPETPDRNAPIAGPTAGERPYTRLIELWVPIGPLGITRRHR